MLRLRLVLLWLVSDLFIFLAAFALAYFLRVGFILSTDFPFDRYILTAAFVAPVWLLSMIVARVFSLTRKQLSLRTISYLAYGAIIATALFSLSYYFLYGTVFSRLLLLYVAGCTFFLSVGWHLFLGFLLRTLLHNPQNPTYPTLIIGATREAASLIRLLNTRKSALTPVAILDGRGTKETHIEGVPVAGKLHKLEETLAQFRITHLIQCAELEQSLNLLSACRQHGITYLLLPSVLGIIERDERIESLEGQPVTVVRPKEPWWKWFFS